MAGARSGFSADSVGFTTRQPGHGWNGVDQVPEPRTTLAVAKVFVGVIDRGHVGVELTANAPARAMVIVAFDSTGSGEPAGGQSWGAGFVGTAGSRSKTTWI